MGPRGRGYAQGPLDKGTLRRAFKYVFASYYLPLLIVAMLIGIGAYTHLRGTLFMQKLIDVYILPLMGTADPDFGPLAGALATLAVIYLIGIGLNLISKLPGLNTINRVTGAVVGLFIGAVLILMFFTAVTALSNTGFGEKCQEAISENKVLDTIYNNNIICDVYFDLAGKIQ